MQISEFSFWLRTQTNKYKRPYQEETITGYTEPARLLDRWMTNQKIEGDFTGCDADMLNRFFAEYRNSHTQNGTNTRQRNLHHLFKWLAVKYDHPDPWASHELVRYGPACPRCPAPGGEPGDYGAKRSPNSPTSAPTTMHKSSKGAESHRGTPSMSLRGCFALMAPAVSTCSSSPPTTGPGHGVAQLRKSPSRSSGCWILSLRIPPSSSAAAWTCLPGTGWPPP